MSLRPLTRPHYFRLLVMALPQLDGYFVCGVCGNAYPKKKKASVCVKQCASELMRDQPILEIKEGKKYSCQLCKRVYPTVDLASRCAHECYSSLNLRIGKSIKTEGALLLSGESSSEAKLLKRKLGRRQALKLVYAKKTHSPTLSLQASADLPEEKINIESEKVAAVSSPMASVERSVGSQSTPVVAAARSVDAGNGESTASKKTNKDPKKQFIRDGAQYTCAVCLSKFFTKMEVVACWEQH